jgi:hypothetical protein
MVEVEFHLLRASCQRPGDIRADMVALAAMRDERLMRKRDC